MNHLTFFTLTKTGLRLKRLFNFYIPSKFNFKLAFPVIAQLKAGNRGSAASIFFIFCLAATSSHALKTEVFAQTTSLTYSEVAPISQFADNLKGPRIQRGNIAFTSNSASLGQSFDFGKQWGSFGYQFFSRIDYSLKFSYETALLYHADENNIELEAIPRDVYLRANNIHADGIGFFYQGEQFKDWVYRVTLSRLQASEMTYGDIKGELTSLEDDAQGYLDLDYFYTEDVVFDREQNDYQATGYTSDFYLKWQGHKQLSIEALAKDYYSSIYWSRQQQTIASATTQRSSVDSDGGRQVRAALLWRELDSDVKQRLPQQLTLHADYALNKYDVVSIEYFSYDNEDFQRLGYRRKFWQRWYAGAYYDFAADALGLEFNSPYLKINVISDASEAKDAQLFGVNASVHLPFTIF